MSFFCVKHYYFAGRLGERTRFKSLYVAFELKKYVGPTWFCEEQYRFHGDFGFQVGHITFARILIKYCLKLLFSLDICQQDRSSTR